MLGLELQYPLSTLNIQDPSMFGFQMLDLESG